MKDKEGNKGASPFDIAIIGMSCNFPGASSVEKYWENLISGKESISFFSDEELLKAGVDATLLENPNYVKAGSVLDDPGLFDAAFFGYSPAEAKLIDPQQRLFLECSWEALESAGYDSDRYQGRIGVFGGALINTYLLFSGILSEFPDNYLPILIASHNDYLTTRVSYHLNLKGPSLAVQTACSTSLVAIHIACQSLLNRECDMALAGGVTVRVPHRAGYLYQEGNIFSPDGHCRPFDAKAKGTVFGSGVGIVVVKRAADAVSDGDHIHAIIKGSAINNDGSLKASFLAPSVDGQVDVILEAIANAEVEADSITFVEAHGTGTAVGDPIEIAALAKAFRAYTQRKGFCAIGSVKSNIGHLDNAAGVAGLIKAVLALENKMIPATLHFQEPNPAIDLNNSPFYVNPDIVEWKSEHYTRRAGVTSLGVGGTNAHVILEEAPVFNSIEESKPWQLLLISAKSTNALDTFTSKLIEHLESHSKQSFADVAFTLQVGRKTFRNRRWTVSQGRHDTVSALKAMDPGRVITISGSPINRDVVFMFSGQGSQYINMGIELYRHEHIFRKHIDSCSEILKPLLSYDLRQALYPKDSDIEEASRRLNQTFFTQPALFVFEYALAQLWMSWGIRPAAFAGHSIGEYTAASLAGVFSLTDALSLVAARGRLLQNLPKGSMLAVPISEAESIDYLGDKLSLAAVNGPHLCVISGESDEIDNLERSLHRKGIQCRKLKTSHAFHSCMVDPIIGTFTEEVRKIQLKPPSIPFTSNVSGTWITKDEATDPNYWARHLRHTVRFSDCVKMILEDPHRVCIEVGPGKTLAMLAGLHPAKGNDHIIVSSTPHPEEAVSDLAHILNSLGHVWSSGLPIDWFAFNAGGGRRRVPLPTYPFERRRHWIKGKKRIDKAYPILGTFSGTEEEQFVSFAIPSEKDDSRRMKIKSPKDIALAVEDILKKCLGIETIGLNDNFFELGGNSLLAIQVLTQIRNMFMINVSLSDFFKDSTIRGLTASIARKVGEADNDIGDKKEKDDIKNKLRLLGDF